MILIIKHVISEGPGLLGAFFKGKNREFKTVELEKGEKLPEAADGFEAVISMGGPMNAYEDEKYPFLKNEDGFLKEVIKKRIPFLGICLGSQLLAKAQGAKIKKAVRKEAGWFKVSLTDEGLRDPLLAGMKRELNVFQWHEDEFEIPEGGKLIVEGGLCRNQAFRIGDCAWGLQFHIEATIGMIEEWVEGKPDSDYFCKKGAAVKIIKDTLKQSGRLRVQANKIFSNLYQIISKRRI